MSDILGGAPDYQGEDVKKRKPGLFAEPFTLALTAFPLSILVILGSQIFRGLSYTIAAAQSVGEGSGSSPDNSYFVAAAFLSAGFSLLPVLLGWAGLNRVIVDDPVWVSGLLRASIVLGGLSLGLRLVIAVIIATNPGTNGLLLNYAGFI